MGKELSSQVLRLTLAISLWLTLAHSSSTLLSLSHFGSLALTRAYFGSLYSSLCLYLAFARHATSLLHNCSLSSPDSVNIAVLQTNHQCVFCHLTNGPASFSCAKFASKLVVVLIIFWETSWSANHPHQPITYFHIHVTDRPHLFIGHGEFRSISG